MDRHSLTYKERRVGRFETFDSVRCPLTEIQKVKHVRDRLYEFLIRQSKCGEDIAREGLLVYLKAVMRTGASFANMLLGYLHSRAIAGVGRMESILRYVES